MNNVNENVPAWQFNTIPGIANQGAILMTRSNIGNPPFNQSDFVWKAMEDIIGTANVKLEYSEPENKYRLYKAKGHRDEEGEWSYEWTKIGEFDALTPETVEMLRVLKYVEYIYDADTPNVLKVVGVKKDGERETILNISYTTVANLNEAVSNLTNSINSETNRATIKENQIESDLNSEVLRSTNKDNELENAITQNTPLSGTATQITQTTSGKTINVKVDNDKIKVNNNNELTADVFDDTETSNQKGWSSSKILSVIHQIGRYRGQVVNYSDLPTQGTVNGDIWKVRANDNYYMWNGTTWDDLESDYTPGNGIDITNRVIGVKAGNGINVDTSGVNVKVDGTSINFDANGNLTAIGSGTVTASNGIQKVNNDIQIKLKPSDSGLGVDSQSDGLIVRTGNSTHISGSNTLEANIGHETTFIQLPNGTTTSAINNTAQDIAQRILLKVEIRFGQTIPGPKFNFIINNISKETYNNAFQASGTPIIHESYCQWYSDNNVNGLLIIDISRIMINNKETIQANPRWLKVNSSGNIEVQIPNSTIVYATAMV